MSWTQIGSSIYGKAVLDANKDLNANRKRFSIFR